MTVVAPAAVLAACDQRQAEIQARYDSWASEEAEHDADLAVVALVRGVAETAQLVMQQWGYTDVQMAMSDSPSHIWSTYRAAANVAAGWLA